MPEKVPVDGLGFDKIVFDFLSKESAREQGSARISVAEAEKETGLSSAQVLRAISIIRSKGYPVISLLTRRTTENEFKIPSTEKEYLDWRQKMIEDLAVLIEVLKVCDDGARAKWGREIPVQPWMF